MYLPIAYFLETKLPFETTLSQKRACSPRTIPILSTNHGRAAAIFLPLPHYRD